LWREVLDMTVCQIKPTGLIDDEVGQSLLEQIHFGIEQGKLFFHFDFSSVRAFDEQGLDKFLQGLKHVFDSGGKHEIFSINYAVYALFRSKGLDTVLNILL
jgi:anti-anti-sigma regulatory factor